MNGFYVCFTNSWRVCPLVNNEHWEPGTEQVPSLTTCGQLRMYHKVHPEWGCSPCHCPGVCCAQELPDIALPSLAVLISHLTDPCQINQWEHSQICSWLRFLCSPLCLLVYQLCLHPKESISLVPWKLCFSQQARTIDSWRCLILQHVRILVY